jgi:hypothetical protein
MKIRPSKKYKHAKAGLSAALIGIQRARVCHVYLGSSTTSEDYYVLLHLEVQERLTTDRWLLYPIA